MPLWEFHDTQSQKNLVQVLHPCQLCSFLGTTWFCIEYQTADSVTDSQTEIQMNNVWIHKTCQTTTQVGNHPKYIPWVLKLNQDHSTSWMLWPNNLWWTRTICVGRERQDMGHNSTWCLLSGTTCRETPPCLWSTVPDCPLETAVALYRSHASDQWCIMCYWIVLVSLVGGSSSTSTLVRSAQPGLLDNFTLHWSPTLSAENNTNFGVQRVPFLVKWVAMSEHNKRPFVCEQRIRLKWHPLHLFVFWWSICHSVHCSRGSKRQSWSTWCYLKWSGNSPAPTCQVFCTRRSITNNKSCAYFKKHSLCSFFGRECACFFLHIMIPLQVCPAEGPFD